MCTSSYCAIVPPHILEALAMRGNVACKRALNDTHRIMQRRNAALNHLLLRSSVPAGGERQIYDSANSYEQRVSLKRREGDPQTQDATVNAAYDSSGYVRDYFRDRFGLNSMDNMGMPVISNVHYGSRYNNAFWDGDEMTYGDGDGEEFLNFASAIDVVAHELAHGITQFQANLEYFGQSGALNEHYSDVFASAIKQSYLGQQAKDADWLIGDTVVAPAFPGKAIRSMEQPGTANEFDIQPDHMDRYYTGSSDNQGVHINSGIPNKAFYLAAMDLGTDVATGIWYDALSQLWRTATFRDLLRTLLRVADVQAGEGRIPRQSIDILTQAFSSVGIGEAV